MFRVQDFMALLSSLISRPHPFPFWDERRDMKKKRERERLSDPLQAFSLFVWVKCVSESLKLLFLCLEGPEKIEGESKRTRKTKKSNIKRREWDLTMFVSLKTERFLIERRLIAFFLLIHNLLLFAVSLLFPFNLLTPSLLQKVILPSSCSR